MKFEFFPTLNEKSKVLQQFTFNFVQITDFGYFFFLMWLK